MTVPSHEFYLHSEMQYREDRALHTSKAWQRLEGRNESWVRRATRRAARRHSTDGTAS